MLFFYTNMTEKEKLLKQTDNTQEESTIFKQIEQEYKLSYDFLSDKFDTWASYLKLYNNQKRESKRFGEPLLFTIQQTVLANLYADELTVKFGPREQGDIETAENLNLVAVNDAPIMRKAEHDLEWDWDAIFFGKGYSLFASFNRKLGVPVPLVLDPTTFLYDPRATSINGDLEGRGRARFCGYEYYMTKYDMKSMGFNNLDEIEDSDDANKMDQARDLRLEAMGQTNPYDKLEGENHAYKILRWFTVVGGRRCFIDVSNNRKLELRRTYLDNGLDIPIIERQIYPMAHDFSGLGIADLIEDKQRMMSVVENLSLENIIDASHQRFMYDHNSIKDPSQLDYSAGSKHIPIDGNPEGRVTQIRHNPIGQEVDWILNKMEMNAQKATSASNMAQGTAMAGGQTATETINIAQGTQTRMNLNQKIFGISEKKWWGQYYYLLKKNLNKDLDKKVLRLSGPLSVKWRTLTPENLIANSDPDITIESSFFSETQRLKRLQSANNYYNLAMTAHQTNKVFALRNLGTISGIEHQELDLLIPRTSDELQALEENERLNKGKKVEISLYDNDQEHLNIHLSANDNVYTQAHNKAHQQSMKAKKMMSAMENPNQFLNSGSSNSEAQTAVSAAATKPVSTQPQLAKV